jgi:hypothetical protein
LCWNLRTTQRVLQQPAALVRGQLSDNKYLVGVGQFGQGSVIPPSSVFDVTGAQAAVTPKPTVANTYQGGTVVKLNRVSFASF